MLSALYATDGTKNPWYETSTVRKVYLWYNSSMVRIVYGTKSLVPPISIALLTSPFDSDCGNFSPSKVASNNFSPFSPFPEGLMFHNRCFIFFSFISPQDLRARFSDRRET